MNKIKRIILVIIFCGLFSCERTGFFNVRFQNLASESIIIEGIKDIKCEKVGRICTESGVKLKQDYSKSFGLSHYRWGRSYLTKKPHFQELYGIKIYYKSKSCLIFRYNIFDDIAPIYDKNNDQAILALTNKGLELLTPDQYEAAKGKYTINDSNVKCIKE
jgi:hypothetical protein